jgi:diaminopimelate decarboxylase
MEIARRVTDRLQRPLQTIDLGGGFGIPYFNHEHELDMQAFGNGLAELMTEVKGDPSFSGTQIMVEPGRFLVGEAGLYVTRVNDIKISRGKKFVIVDGGMHHHLAASGNLGQTIKRNFPLAVLNKLTSAPEEKVDVVGPLCTPLDVLGRAVTLPKAEVGDLIGVFQSGAYARTASPLGFLSHPAPPEVWVEEGRAYSIRRRGTYEDYLVDLCDLSGVNLG